MFTKNHSFAMLACTGVCLFSISNLRADEAPAAPALETEEQKISYIIGTSIGQNMREDGLDIDMDAFLRGISDALEERELAMTEEQMMASMQAFQVKMMEQQQQAMAAEADNNATAGAEFLAENAKREGVTTTESGLQYEVIEAGEGARPTADGTVTVHYTGSLIDGTVFDSSVERGQPASFGVSQVIPGWTEALQLMPAGSKWRVFIPSNLAYGEQGAGGGAIGPNETLIFEVELLEVNE